MNDRSTDPAAAEEGGTAYHLLLEAQEVRPAVTALRLLISDGAHQGDIRRLAREVLAELEPALEEDGEAHATLSVALSAPQMKITYTALRLLLDDLSREQAEEMQVLHAILGKLPDEHSIRAIVIE